MAEQRLDVEEIRRQVMEFDRPAWVNVIGVDPNGEVWAFDKAVRFDPSEFLETDRGDHPSGAWVPVDHFEDVHYTLIGLLRRALSADEASRLCFPVRK